MITFTVKVDPGLKGDVAKNVGALIRQVAFAIEAEMKLLMTGPKTGRAYKRGGGIHIASAPGEAPAVDTGFLINSIQTRVISDTQAEITVAAEYAEILEFHMNRPFVRPAIESVIEEFSRGGILAGLRE